MRSVTFPVVVPESSVTVHENELMPSFLNARRSWQLCRTPVVCHTRLTGWSCQLWQVVGVDSVGEKHVALTVAARAEDAATTNAHASSRTTHRFKPAAPGA